jgi:hypothetical protein
VAAGLGAAAALDAESSAPVLAGAGSAILFLGLGQSTRRSGAIPIALLLLGALHVIPDGDPSIGTVIYGSCLLLTAELAYWSIDEHGHRPVQPGVFAPRLLAILAVVAAAISASVLVHVAAGIDIPRSPASTAAGATATVACVVLLAAMACRRAERAPDAQDQNRTTRPGPDRWPTPAMKANGVRTAVVVAALTMLVGVVAIASNEPTRHFAPEAPQPSADELERIGVITPGFPVPGALPPEVYPPDCCGLDTGPDLRWLLVVMTAAGLVGLLAAAVVLVPQLMRWRPRRPRLRWRRRRRRRNGEPPATEPAVIESSPADAEADAEAARRILDAALEPLHEPTDPRAAVIEAYARMEQILASRELGRRIPEAPREYLTRVLRQQGMPEHSLASLTELFEEARFSAHPIPASASARAHRALETARAELP